MILMPFMMDDSRSDTNLKKRDSNYAGIIVLLIGMSYAYTMLGSIDKDYQVFTVMITPPLFMAVSIPIIVVGALLFRLKKRPKRYF